MKKSTLVFWVNASSFGLLALTLLTVPLEVGSHSFIHGLPGLLLVASSGLHLWLHRDWIKVAFSRFGKMPRPAQENALLDLALFGAYLTCGSLGVFSRRGLAVSMHLHIFIVFMHILAGLLVLALQSIHLVRHLKWIKANLLAHIFIPSN